MLESDLLLTWVSTSRVGSVAQIKAMKQIARKSKLE